MSNDVERFREDQDRRLPPMNQMTRIQKRYLLEPWFTVGWLAAWILAFPLYLLGIFTPMHWQFGLTGLLFTVIGAGFSWAKYEHRDLNQRTEGEVRSRSSDYGR